MGFLMTKIFSSGDVKNSFDKNEMHFNSNCDVQNEVKN